MQLEYDRVCGSFDYEMTVSPLLSLSIDSINARPVWRPKQIATTTEIMRRIGGVQSTQKTEADHLHFRFNNSRPIQSKAGFVFHMQSHAYSGYCF